MLNLKHFSSFKFPIEFSKASNPESPINKHLKKLYETLILSLLIDI